MRRIIAITLGDPSGIGPEVVRKALRSGKLDRRFRYEVVLGSEIPRVAPGRPSRLGARFALRALEAGVAGCLDGRYAALVTGPVNKAALKAAGFRFPGQTEWLAARTGAKAFAMMLVGGRLRVALVTIHTPLRDVPRLLSRRKVRETIRLAHAALRRFGIRQPKIAVAALNPHGGAAGEEGIEERRIVAPAVRDARRRLGGEITGPHTPDAIFRDAWRGKVDAVVCMYHDQGLIPLKMVAFDQGVNLTLGLPIVRTSPDHGTAYALAGKNRADPGSLIAAIRLAAKLSARGGEVRPI
ncbi:MAG: 4-hydroxythreonine-4-phosphate dehydrogenase PdxA [Verrucomicrobiae bacterium]|nr:4-hydroxythreonine-4-phosphate dehydrogenase PdxA [Verrucomicrobiae bacterium]